MPASDASSSAVAGAGASSRKSPSRSPMATSTEAYVAAMSPISRPRKATTSLFSASGAPVIPPPLGWSSGCLEPLLDQRVDRLAVGLALRRLHHLAHERAHRLAVTADELVPDRWVGGDDLVDGSLERAGVHRLVALRCRDRGGVAAARDHLREDRLGLGG